MINKPTKKLNIDKPLEEVWSWKKAVSKKISKLTRDEELKYFKKLHASILKHKMAA